MFRRKVSLVPRPGNDFIYKKMSLKVILSVTCYIIWSPRVVRVSGGDTLNNFRLRTLRSVLRLSRL